LLRNVSMMTDDDDNNDDEDHTEYKFKSFTSCQS